MHHLRFAGQLGLLVFWVVSLWGQGVPLEQILREGVTKSPRTSGSAGPSRSPESAGGKPQAPARTDSAARPASAAAAGALPFTIRLAPGWRAQMTPDNGALAQSADGSSTIAVLPVLQIGEQNPVSWMRKHGVALLARHLAHVKLETFYPSRNRADTTLAGFSFRSPGGEGKGSIMLFRQGGVGTLYVMGAPAQQYEQRRPELLAMLRSFSFRGEQVRSNETSRDPVPTLKFTRFRDPNEGAFSLEVPANWRVEGGTVRRSEVDINTFVRVSSPDGIVVTLGDEYIPRFIVPTATMASLGLSEGGRYSPFPGNVLIVQRYLPGAAYAQLHAKPFAQRMGVSAVQMEQARERRELFKQLPSIGVTTTGGDVRFRGQRGGSECEGYVMAATSLMALQGQEGGVWHVQSLVSYVAPRGRSAVANAAVAGMLGSIQMNPRWVAQQRQASAETYRQVKETNDYIAGLFRETREQQQQVRDRQQREFGDYIRGVVRLRDTETGEVFEGKAGNNYYWRVRQSDTLIGSDLHTPPPNIDLSEMEQVR